MTLAPAHSVPADRESDAERALEVLLDGSLDPIVDMVLLARDGAYEAHCPRRVGPLPAYRREAYEIVAGEGDEPARRPVDRPLRRPRRRARAPPPAPARELLPVRASTTIAQLFDHPAAPDLCVIHSAAHNWEDQGGHRGEHGSLGVVQARAPFVIAGRGVRADGHRPASRRGSSTSRRRSPRCSAWRRTPTARHLTGQDGEVRHDVLDAGAGAAAARRRASCSTGPTRTCSTRWPQSGEAPNVARLIEHGHRLRARRDGGAADRHARQPHVDPHRPPARATTGSSTTPGTTAPTGEQVITNSAATWPTAMQSLDTRRRVAPRRRPPRRGRTRSRSSVNEPCDTGADFSTFDFFRRGEVPPFPTSPDGSPAHDRAVRAPVEGLLVVDHRRPHGGRAGRRHLVGRVPRRHVPAPALHVGELHPHRLGVPRGRAALGDRGGVGARQRRPPRRGARRDRARRRRSTTPRSCSWPTTGWRRTTRRCGATGTSTCAAAGLRFRDEGYSFLYLGEG